MLDVHPPHTAVHGWRDFFIHIATIVIGLCIAVGIEQTVEHFHHGHQVAETREALHEERKDNHQRFADGAAFWRWGVAAIQNNLVVLRYLQQHPGTPQEKLPGVLTWAQNNAPFTYSVWDGAQQTGVTSLMPRDEVAEDADLYKHLHAIGEASGKVWQAINNAEQFNLTNYDPTRLSPTRLAEVIALTENIQTQQYLQGIELVNLADGFHDFPKPVTLDEIHQLRHAPDTQTREELAPARTQTNERIESFIQAAETVSQRATAEKK
jgi:hypothetical protein